MPFVMPLVIEVSGGRSLWFRISERNGVTHDINQMKSPSSERAFQRLSNLDRHSM